MPTSMSGRRRADSCSAATKPTHCNSILASSCAGFRIEDLKLDLAVLRRLADSVALEFPIFQGVALQEHRGGLPTMTADGEHVLGAAPGVAGLFVIGGCCVGGLTTAPALGELLSAWIVQGHPPPGIDFMSPSRLAMALPDE